MLPGMSEHEVPFIVLAALVTLYIVAASWRSRDAADRSPRRGNF